MFSDETLGLIDVANRNSYYKWAGVYGGVVGRGYGGEGGGV